MEYLICCHHAFDIEPEVYMQWDWTGRGIWTSPNTEIYKLSILLMSYVLLTKISATHAAP